MSAARQSLRFFAVFLGCLLALVGRCDATGTFFVDSIAGNDSAAGTSPETAFATLSRVRSLIADGTTVRLRRGSLFRDHLSLGTAMRVGITINAYGDGPRPIIDGADNVPVANWSPTDPANSPGVFQIDFTPGPFSPIDNIQVVENDYRLPRAASLASCAAQPGSSFEEPLGGGLYRIYVHPTTSSLDGRSLAVARRDCIRIWGHDHRVDDLHLRNAVSGTGALGIFEGDNFHASNLLLENGTRHHMVVSNGTFQNCTFYNLQATPVFPSVYSLYRAEIGGAWIEFYNCTFVQDLRFATAAEVAVAHGDASSVGWPSHALHRGCRFFNFAGPGGVSALGFFSFEDCLLSNVRDGFRSHRVRFANSAWLGDRTSDSADFVLAGSMLDFDLRFTDSFIDAYRFFQAPLSTSSRLEVRNCQILARAGINLLGSDLPGTLIFENNLLDADWFLQVSNLPIPASLAWTIQSNQFYGGMSFDRGTPNVVYPDGDYLYTAGEHHRLSQWLLDRGQVGNGFFQQSSRRAPSFSQEPAIHIQSSDWHIEVRVSTQLGASCQLSTSKDLQSWTPVGASRPGNGREIFWIFPNSGRGSDFFRATATIP